jgi:hypothetical protein
MLSLLALAACRPERIPLGGGTPDPYVGSLCLEETAAPAPKIARDLRQWGDALVASDNKYFGTQSWEALEALGEDDLGDTPDEIRLTRLVRGWDRLRFADFAGAKDDLDKALLLDGDPLITERLYQVLGIAWMRDAETVNCVAHGSGESCIVPFGPHAVHLDPSYMASASAQFEQALAMDPDQPSVVWLDNVAYMAQGTWPDDVPEAYQLPPGFLDPEEELPAWPNVMPDLGITDSTLAGGAAIEDFDGDGRLDLLVSTIDPHQGMALYANTGTGGFCRASDASGVSSIPGLLSFSVVDYDNDGDMDVFGPRAGWMGAEGHVRPSLLRNDGHGHFEDVAVEAGFDDPAINGPTQVSAWADVNGDGWLDVYVGRESTAEAPSVSSLYLSRGDGTFVDVGAEAGLQDGGWVKGATFFDYDLDGDPDLYVSDFGGANQLYDNQGDGAFVDRAEEFGLIAPQRSFAVAALDYDQDGRQDLFVTSFSTGYGGWGPTDPNAFRSTEAWYLDRAGLPPAPDLPADYPKMYHNTAEGWVDVTAELGLDDIETTMGLSFGDLDADSWPDLMQATGTPDFDSLLPKAAYRNDEGRWFSDVTTATGMGSIQKGHGVSFGDVDQDGDEDLLQELGGAFVSDVAPNQLFVNPTNGGAEVGRHTVTLRLEGVTVNRSAVGARVRVVTASRDRWKWVGETGSFGNDSLQLEFGLGDDDEVERVEVEWSQGDVEVLEDVPVDSIVWIRQGDGVVDARPYEPVVLTGVER